MQYGAGRKFYGFVHDHCIEGPPKVDAVFSIRRIALADVLDDFFFDQGYEHLIGASLDAASGRVVDLAIGRRIATIGLPGMPHLGSGITWDWGETTVMATPHLLSNTISIIDTGTWQTVRRLPMKKPSGKYNV